MIKPHRMRLEEHKQWRRLSNIVYKILVRQYEKKELVARHRFEINIKMVISSDSLIVFLWIGIGIRIGFL